MSKVYLHATAINKFEWVDKPEKATALDEESMAVTLKQLQGAKLEQALKQTLEHEPGWTISSEA